MSSCLDIRGNKAAVGTMTMFGLHVPPPYSKEEGQSQIWRYGQKAKTVRIVFRHTDKTASLPTKVLKSLTAQTCDGFEVVVHPEDRNAVDPEKEYVDASSVVGSDFLSEVDKDKDNKKCQKLAKTLPRVQVRDRETGATVVDEANSKPRRKDLEEVIDAYAADFAKREAEAVPAGAASRLAIMRALDKDSRHSLLAKDSTQGLDLVGKSNKSQSVKKSVKASCNDEHKGHSVLAGHDRFNGSHICSKSSNYVVMVHDDSSADGSLETIHFYRPIDTAVDAWYKTAYGQRPFFYNEDDTGMRPMPDEFTQGHRWMFFAGVIFRLNMRRGCGSMCWVHCSNPDPLFHGTLPTFLEGASVQENLRHDGMGCAFLLQENVVRYLRGDSGALVNQKTRTKKSNALRAFELIPARLGGKKKTLNHLHLKYLANRRRDNLGGNAGKKAMKLVKKCQKKATLLKKGSTRNRQKQLKKMREYRRYRMNMVDVSEKRKIMEQLLQKLGVDSRPPPGRTEVPQRCVLITEEDIGGKERVTFSNVSEYARDKIDLTSDAVESTGLRKASAVLRVLGCVYRHLRFVEPWAIVNQDTGAIVFGDDVKKSLAPGGHLPQKKTKKKTKKKNKRKGEALLEREEGSGHPKKTKKMPVVEATAFEEEGKPIRKEVEDDGDAEVDVWRMRETPTPVWAGIGTPSVEYFAELQSFYEAGKRKLSSVSRGTCGAIDDELERRTSDVTSTSRATPVPEWTGAGTPSREYFAELQNYFDAGKKGITSRIDKDGKNYSNSTSRLLPGGVCENPARDYNKARDSFVAFADAVAVGNYTPDFLNLTADVDAHVGVFAENINNEIQPCRTPGCYSVSGPSVAEDDLVDGEKKHERPKASPGSKKRKDGVSSSASRSVEMEKEAQEVDDKLRVVHDFIGNRTPDLLRGPG